MYIGPHEWLPASCPAQAPRYAALYRALADGRPGPAQRESAAALLRDELEAARCEPCELPESPDGLFDWMQAGAQAVHAAYGAYLEQRKAGAPRRYFENRAHALYFLRSVAPTKLVDGAWLYGLVEHARNPRFADLVRTYVEELGEGVQGKNHVVLYRSLLARYGLDPIDDLPDALYRQGLVQLALAWNAQDFLPELIGFNLGYEQLPLHLLITAYELNELGLDPYYFQLHVTVDNAGTGHARRACQAVLDTLPRIHDGGEFWRRVREGSKLANAGTGTAEVIAGFDIGREVVRVLAHKSTAGAGAHSDYCRVAGRSVNDWLASPDNAAGFLQQLEKNGWIRRGEPAENSRFWGLLQGERAEMFGVFSSYELQVIHDWIRGEASRDGRAFSEVAPADENRRRRATFRALQRNAPAAAPDGAGELLDPDLQVFKDRLAAADDAGRRQLLVEAMSPASHWTPAGLYATQLFWQAMLSN